MSSVIVEFLVKFVKVKESSVSPLAYGEGGPFRFSCHLTLWVKSCVPVTVNVTIWHHSGTPLISTVCHSTVSPEKTKRQAFFSNEVKTSITR